MPRERQRGRPVRTAPQPDPHPAVVDAAGDADRSRAVARAGGPEASR